MPRYPVADHPDTEILPDGSARCTVCPAKVPRHGSAAETRMELSKFDCQPKTAQQVVHERRVGL